MPMVRKLQPIKGLWGRIVNALALTFVKAQPWKHDFLYSLICEQAVVQKILSNDLLFLRFVLMF